MPCCLGSVAKLLSDFDSAKAGLFHLKFYGL